MRVNVYAEEMTDRIEIISKQIDGHKFTGLRFYLELPVTVKGLDGHAQVAGPVIHRPGDDDSAAVTFWGKQDLRTVLRKALAELDKHYETRERATGAGTYTAHSENQPKMSPDREVPESRGGIGGALPDCDIWHHRQGT